MTDHNLDITVEPWHGAHVLRVLEDGEPLPADSVRLVYDRRDLAGWTCEIYQGRGRLLKYRAPNLTVTFSTSDGRAFYLRTDAGKPILNHPFTESVNPDRVEVSLYPGRPPAWSYRLSLEAGEG